MIALIMSLALQNATGIKEEYEYEIGVKHPTDKLVTRIYRVKSGEYEKEDNVKILRTESGRLLVAVHFKGEGGCSTVLSLRKILCELPVYKNEVTLRRIIK